MSRVVRFAAWLLLAVWLPATLHCALESADLIPASAICADGTTDHCVGDHCTQVEEGLFKQKTDELQVMSPDLLACACFLCLQLPPSTALDGFTFPPSDQPQAWVTTWHFVRRNAPAPRAPALLIA